MKYNKLSCAYWAAASCLMSAARPQTLPNSRQHSYHTCSKRIRPFATNHRPPSPSNSPKLSSTFVPHVQHTHPAPRHQPQAAFPPNSPKLSSTLVPHVQRTHPASHRQPEPTYPPKLSRTLVNSRTTPSQTLPRSPDPSPLTTTVPSTAVQTNRAFVYNKATASKRSTPTTFACSGCVRVSPNPVQVSATVNQRL